MQRLDRTQASWQAGPCRPRGGRLVRAIIAAVAVCIATIACSAGPALALDTSAAESATLIDAAPSVALAQFGDEQQEPSVEGECATAAVCYDGSVDDASALGDGPRRWILWCWRVRGGLRCVLIIYKSAEGSGEYLADAEPDHAIAEDALTNR